jgi:serine/threonine-protein kinase ATR
MPTIYSLQGAPLMENKLFKNTDDSADLLSMVLKLSWSHSLVITEPHNTWKTKCISVQVASKLGSSLKTETGVEVLDLSLCDEVEE